MECILSDISKLKLLGPVSEFDETGKNEAKLQRHLLKLVKADELPQNVYQVIRPTGSHRPRMYGLPKIHKQNVP